MSLNGNCFYGGLVKLKHIQCILICSSIGLQKLCSKGPRRIPSRRELKFLACMEFWMVLYMAPWLPLTAKEIPRQEQIKSASHSFSFFQAFPISSSNKRWLYDWGFMGFCHFLLQRKLPVDLAQNGSCLFGGRYGLGDCCFQLLPTYILKSFFFFFLNQQAALIPKYL